MANEADPRTAIHARLAVAGDIDIATVDGLMRDSHQLLADRPGHLTLDFTRVNFCDAAGIGALVKIHLECLAAGCDFTLANVGAHVRSIMRIVGIEEILRIEDDQARG
ncbi:MAG: hypothetical protein AUI14_06135 [Actinobacteria bacterium 13_2_20CM_2_71_6]|nr:MAG: hypothetical protein AUI14_06135 [Actinobacteria bacterium 13_2_20CM_2_71_6]